ncbi:MAG: hypothetical protein JXX28_19830 [Deltaproteobacteria bacterium]|nr:hypothetical protein [Deltaproteobacteria bacterium]
MAAKLTGTQRAALLLMYLEKGAAEKLLLHLTPGELRKIGMAMAEVERFDQQIIETVVADFVRQLHTQSMVPTTGLDYALGPYPEMIDEQRRPRVQSALKRELSQAFVEYIRGRPPRTVSTLLQDEHPQAQAVALLLMGIDNASEVLLHFDEQERFEVAYRMARIEQVPGELADDVEASLWEALEDRGHERWKVVGVDQTASVLGRLKKSVTDDVLERMNKQDEALSDTLRKRMVVFEDLGSLDNKGAQALLKNVERSVLLVALRGTSPELLQLFTGNMSSRAAADLLDEMSIMSPLPKSEVNKAREEVVQMALSLQEEGVIRIATGGGEEML